MFLGTSGFVFMGKNHYLDIKNHMTMDKSIKWVINCAFTMSDVNNVI